MHLHFPRDARALRGAGAARRHLFRATSSFLAAALAAGPALAGVLVVDAAGGPGFHHFDVQAAVDAAQDFDTILVRSGQYPPFVVTAKSLTIVADAGADVIVSAVNGAPGIELIGGGVESVHLRGIAVEGDQPEPGIRMFGIGGGWLEEIQASGCGAGLEVIQSTATLSLCSLSGASGEALAGTAGPGLFAAASVLVATRCDFNGGVGFTGPAPGTPGGDGGTGALVTGGSLFAIGCEFVGGGGGAGFDDFIQCSAGGAGGTGLELGLAAPSVTLVGGGVTEGAGGSGGLGAALPCADGAAGAPVVVQSGALSADAAEPRFFTATSPVRGGQVAFFKIGAQPGDQALLLLGLTPLVAQAAEFHGALQVAPIHVLPFVTSSTGFTIPALPPGLPAVTLYLQPAFLDAQGQAHLHQGSALTLLDASL